VIDGLHSVHFREAGAELLMPWLQSQLAHGSNLAEPGQDDTGKF